MNSVDTKDPVTRVCHSQAIISFVWVIYVIEFRGSLAAFSMMDTINNERHSTAITIYILKWCHDDTIKYTHSDQRACLALSVW